MSSSSLTRPMLFVVGLQKSGTTLLQRLLSAHPGICDPWQGREGNEFWGNPPKFEDDGPAGRLAQQAAYGAGHALGAEHAQAEVARELADRLATLLATQDEPAKAAYLLNKNPYNTVRIPWLKALFPQARVVAMVRAPVANAFSLLKRASKVPHRLNDGWFGVKPPGWPKLQDPSMLMQSARQWVAINDGLLAELHRVDSLLVYNELCADPRGVLAALFDELGLARAPAANLPATIRAYDDEYREGAALVSKNKLMKRQDRIDLEPAPGVSHGDWLPPLTAAEAGRVEAMCRDTWTRLLDAPRFPHRAT